MILLVIIMAKTKNKMAKHAVEATGLRVIGMYVQEYFHWGWQPYSQENDDGIDGEIIPRYKNGQDMGVRIKVQSKCGPGYLSSITDEYVSISPYSTKERLIDHIDSWNRSNEPVILVYTNAEKKNHKGHKYLDLKNPCAWWVRMDDYQHDGSSIVRIPRGNLFQEHTKGELVKLIEPYIKEWPNYKRIIPDNMGLSLWNFSNLNNELKDNAKNYYKNWKDSNPIVYIGGKEYPLHVTRIGWRHITNKARKDRVELSLRLLPIAKIILEKSKDIRPVLLRSRVLNTVPNSQILHFGFRARVKIKGEDEKVQVVVKRYKNLKNDAEKVWFYSVHIVKRKQESEPS